MAKPKRPPSNTILQEHLVALLTAQPDAVKLLASGEGVLRVDTGVCVKCGHDVGTCKGKVKKAYGKAAKKQKRSTEVEQAMVGRVPKDGGKCSDAMCARGTAPWHCESGVCRCACHRVQK